MAELKNLGKYKIVPNKKHFVPSETQDVVQWLNDKDNVIPVIILEQQYGEANSYAQLSGLKLIYELRKAYYGGPIIALSILSIDQIRLLIREYPNLFQEKSERILRTSNIGFFNVRENSNQLKNKILEFIEENQYLSINRFSIDDIIRYATSHFSAVENLLHDLKNLLYTSIKSTTFSLQAEAIISQLEENHIKLKFRKEFLNEKTILLKKINLSESSKDIATELIETFKNRIKRFIIADDTNENQIELGEFTNDWEVLVIDDNVDTAKEIAENLKLNNFISHYATNFNEALDIFDELEHLIWIISDYRLLENGTNENRWQTLQGADLLQLLHEKAEGKKMHLTVLSSKRDIINRANEHLWNPPMTFFYKELLRTKESFRIFIETQLPYIIKIQEQNNVKFDIPVSWMNVQHLTLEKNIPDYRSFIKQDHFDSKGDVMKGQALADYYLELHQNSFKGDWKSLWNLLITEVTKNETWESYNDRIDEFVLEKVKFAFEKLKGIKNIPPAIERINNKNFLKIMENRLIWRRVMLGCLMIYRNSEIFNKDLKPHQYYNAIWDDFKKRKVLKSNPSHFRYINAFEPEDILDAELNFNYKSIPYVERDFIVKFKKYFSLA